MKKIFITSLLITACKLYFVNAKGQSSKQIIVIVKGFKKLTGDCWYSSTSPGYKWLTAYGDNAKLRNLKNEIENKYVADYGVDSNSLQTVTNWLIDAYTACVISYYKNKGKNCQTFHYAFGFGKSRTEALNKAIKNKNLYDADADYSLETYID